MSLEALAAMSHQYGSDPQFVLAGGGNTSFKDGDVLYIKGSGVSLAEIRTDQFVRMDRPSLTRLWGKNYPDDEKEREAAVLSDLLAARLPGEEKKRPSVETLLHHLLPQPYVLHVHPASINGLTCSRDGERAMRMLFNEAVFVPSTKPGYVLAVQCRRLVDRYINRYARYPRILFLQNHGVFFAGESPEEIDRLVSMTQRRMEGIQKRLPDRSEAAFDAERAASVLPAVRMLYGGVHAKVVFSANAEILRFAKSREAFAPLMQPYTPDQIVYCKAKPLFISVSGGADPVPALMRGFSEYTSENGYAPKVIVVEGLGMFTCGKTRKEAATAAQVFTDAAYTVVYTEGFGGPLPMDDALVDFIVHWEAESYRAGLAAGSENDARCAGKIALLCNVGRTYGEAIATELAAAGAYLLLAGGDRTVAEELSDNLNETYGNCCSVISSDLSTKGAMRRTVTDAILFCGGLDLVLWFSDDDKRDNAADDAAFRYLCGCAGEKMAIEHQVTPSYLTDIIDVGGMCSGLDEIAKSAIANGTKVNAIRPSKLSRTPMGRACHSRDVALALDYLIEQQFETALTLPVSGGERLVYHNR